MRRSEYDDVPNRIIPPYISIDSRRPEYERSSRVLSTTSIRQPLLGEAPVESYRHGYGHAVAFNGPVIDPNRRRGFDKGPTGEDYAGGGRQPLLKNPRLAIEHVGGDMDISRSRSASPDVQIISARTVRDDRRRERGDRSDRSDRDRSRRSRSRSRSRDRSRAVSSHRTRDRDDVREKYEPAMPISHDQIRDGLLHTSDNYFEFLNFFMDEMNERSRKSLDRDIQGTRKLVETVTRATDAEKSKLVLPPSFDNSDRERMLHCDTILTGLPASIFFGSGYGSREHYAKNSAAKDFVDKCNRIGVINSELHAAINDCHRIDRAFKAEFRAHISKAANACLLLIKKMATEQLPPGFMTLRIIPPELIDRFKMMLRLVMIDVYYDGMEPEDIPPALETSSSRPRDSDMRRQNRSSHEKGPTPDEIIRSKEKEIKERMERELEKKRSEMEQEIRRQVLEEERAKIRAELEMEKKIELMKMQEKQYQLDKEKKEQEEQKKAAMLKEVEDDFNKLVEQLEQRFVEVRAKGLNHILDMIHASGTFKTMCMYSTTLTSLSYEQKKQLVHDLRILQDTITKEVAAATAMNHRQVPMMGGYAGIPIQAPQLMPTYQMPQQLPQQQMPPQQFFNHSLPARSSASTSSSSTRKEEIGQSRVRVGNMQLRELTNSEKRRLSKGDKVIAQDAKTGTWMLVTVVKVSRDERVTVSIGNTGNTWKKSMNELYKEDVTASAY